MDNQISTAAHDVKSQNQSRTIFERFARYVLGFCVLFIVSAVSFCPVTQAALANVFAPTITGLTFGFEWIAHMAFFGLLVIGLRMRTKYQD